MSYIVIEEKSISELVDEVVKWRQKGFKPTGGITRAEGFYIQAMYQESFTMSVAKPISVDKPKKPSIDDLEVIKWNFSSSVFTPIIEIAYTWKGVHAETTIAEQLPVAIRDEREITVMLFKQLIKDGII